MTYQIRKRVEGEREYFQLDTTKEGKRYRIAIPKARTLKEAKRRGEGLYLKLLENLRQEKQAPKASGLSISRAIEDHASNPSFSPATRAMKVRCAKPLVRELGPETKCTDVTTEALVRYMKKRLRSVSPRTFNIEVGILASAMRDAQAQGLIQIPEGLSFPKAPERSKRTRALSPEEVSRIVEEARPLGIGDHVEFIANTGLRASEFRGLTWDQVDMKRKTITIKRKRGGATTERFDELPLNNACMSILKRRGEAKGTQGLVFGVSPEERDDRRAVNRKRGKGTLNGTTYHGMYRFRNKLKQAARQAGVAWWKDIRLHDFRHTLATNLLYSGTPLQLVSRVMRHSSPNVTAGVYAHVLGDDAKEALDSWHKSLVETQNATENLSQNLSQKAARRKK